MLILVSCCTSCASLATPHPLALQRSTAAPCFVDGDTVACQRPDGGSGRVTLPFAPSAFAERPAGGAWLLGGSGQLVRISRRGELSGVHASDFVRIVTIAGLLCGLTEDATVRCTRDARSDATCSTAPMPELWTALPLPRAIDLANQNGALCLTNDVDAQVCFGVDVGCDSACLAYPACGPARCADPCRGDEVLSGIRLRALGPAVGRGRVVFSSSDEPATGT